MRPEDYKGDLEVYECPDCGVRYEDPESNRCEHCGGELLDLGRPRDF